MDKILTYEEAHAIALEYYDKGGDQFYECIGREDFKNIGPLTKPQLLKYFGFWKDYSNDMINTGR